MLVYKGEVKGATQGSIGVATSLKGKDVYFFDLFRFERDYNNEKEIVVGDKIELEEWYICLLAKSLKLAVGML